MHRQFPQWNFNVCFVAPVDAEHIPPDNKKDARRDYCTRLPGCIEVPYNYGTEAEHGFVYNTGNADKAGVILTGAENAAVGVTGGFGHIGITVPDVFEACERFKDLGCEFKKTPNYGGMKGMAFLKDPDGYLFEVLPQGPMITKPVDCFGVSAERGEGYKDNSKEEHE